MISDSIMLQFATDLEWVYECNSWFFDMGAGLSYLSDWGIQYTEKYNGHKYNKVISHLNSNKLYFKKTKPHTRGRIMKRIKK